jgi:hypothetical protein
MTFGFSRDDIGGFLPDYLDQKILPVDPFQVLDRDSVGVLVETGIEKGRSPPAPTSRSGSAASTAASPTRWSSATWSAWTTSAARPSACPSRGWRRRHATRSTRASARVLFLLRRCV